MAGESGGCVDAWLSLISITSVPVVVLAGFLSLGFSTPFLSVGSSYMYSSLSTAKAAVMAAGDEIANNGLASGICPLVFVFTGAGNGTFQLWSMLPTLRPTVY